MKAIVPHRTGWVSAQICSAKNEEMLVSEPPAFRAADRVTSQVAVEAPAARAAGASTCRGDPLVTARVCLPWAKVEWANLMALSQPEGLARYLLAAS